MSLENQIQNSNARLGSIITMCISALILTIITTMTITSVEYYKTNFNEIVNEWTCSMLFDEILNDNLKDSMLRSTVVYEYRYDCLGEQRPDYSSHSKPFFNNPRGRI